MSATDRFSSREDIKWNKGCYDDGYEARCIGQPMSSAPSLDLATKFARDSWLAGWADADAGIEADGLSEKMPVIKAKQ